MDNKIYKIVIILLIAIILCMGVYIYGIQKDLTLNDYFDVSRDYTSEWNDNTKECTVEKVFPLKFNQTYSNITTEVTFFKDSSQLDSISVVNDTQDGKLVVHSKIKLSEKPTNIEFNIQDGELIDSDTAGLEYSRNFHLF